MLKFINFKELIQSLRTCLELANVEVKRLIFFTFVLGVCSASIEFLFAVILQDFFSHLGLFQISNSTYKWQSPSLKWAMLSLLTVGFFRSMSEGFKIFLSRLAQQKFAQNIRLKLIERALWGAGTISSSKVLSLFSDETNRSSNSILNLASFFIQATLSVMLFVFCLFSFTKATFFGLFILILLFLPFRIFERRIVDTGVRLSEEWETTNTVLTEGIRNNFYLKVIGKIDDEINRAAKSIGAYLQVFKKAFFLISFKSSIPSFLGIVVLIIIAYSQHTWVIFGKGFSYLEFFYLFLRFTQSASTSLSLLGDYKINVESSRRLKSWFSENEPKPVATSNELMLEGKFHITLENISFFYGNYPVLRNLGLVLNEGDFLVIKGESGVGKSTLLSLILGALSPTEGQIRVNGLSLQEIGSSMPSYTSYVGPHPFLIEGTIFSNLIYGLDKNKPSEQEVLRAIEFSCLTDLISSLPKGVMTQLNEIGSSLSTGQKQRLMIARALLRRPKLLIMDEATANLDAETELKLIQNLREQLKDVICIVVTHKNSFDLIATQKMELKRS